MLVCAFVCAFVSAFVCSFRGLFACVLSWVEILRLVLVPVAYGLIVASYRRRLGIVVVREFARHRYRQSQLVGLTREQLTAIARDAQRQRAGATRGEELAALVVELAQQRVVPAAERHGG